MEEEIPYDEKQQASDILQELNEFRKTKQHCDFVIKIGSEEIHVHKNILCANSEYFRAILIHDTEVRRSGFVELKGMDTDCVIKCADFMYGRKITVSKERWELLICAADMLQLHKLREFLADFVGSGLCVESFFKIKHFANTYNCENLEAKCDEFALENFDAISQLDGFKQLTKEYVSFLLESPLNGASGIKKMERLLDWIRFDSGTRGKLLTAMMSNIDLTRIPLQHRRHLLENEALFFESFDCYKILSASMLDDLGATPIKLSGKNDEDCTLSSGECLQSSTRTIAIFDDSSRHLQCFNPEKNCWRRMHPLTDDMIEKNFSAILLVDYIYVLMANKTAHRLWYSDPNAKWERMADMIECHGMWPPVTTDGYCLYVASTRSRKNVHSEVVECYVPTVNKWMKLTENVMHKDIACVYLNKNIYCIGGYCFQKSVQRFNLVTKEWSNAAPMLIGRSNASAVTLFNKIYVVGGHGRFAECYNSNDNSWTQLSSMMTVQRSNFSSFLTNRNMFAVGGCAQCPSTIDKFSLEEDEWTQIAVPEQMNLKVLWSVGLPVP